MTVLIIFVVFIILADLFLAYALARSASIADDENL